MKIINKLFVGCFVLGSIFLASCSSCSNSKEKGGRSANQTDTVPTFCKADTTQVLKMAEDYLEALKNQKYDEALSKLNLILNDSVKPLPEKDKQMIIRQQQVFPVLDYHLESFKFINEHRVEVTYSIEFFKKEDPNDPIQNTIRITFAPQRINAQWYLALMDKSYVTYTPEKQKDMETID